MVWIFALDDLIMLKSIFQNPRWPPAATLKNVSNRQIDPIQLHCKLSMGG
jgi:hypothetical protein